MMQTQMLYLYVHKYHRHIFLILSTNQLRQALPSVPLSRIHMHLILHLFKLIEFDKFKIWIV